MRPSPVRSIAPECDLVLLAFPLHVTWEFVQAPLYANMLTASHMEGVRACLVAAMGDVVIALIAFWTASVVAGSRGWVKHPSRNAVSAYMASGLLITVGLEYLNADMLGRWTYGPLMPRLPLIGTGLAPLMQWCVLPVILLWYLRRLAGPINPPH
jgi:hypothetical protein